MRVTLLFVNIDIALVPWCKLSLDSVSLKPASAETALSRDVLTTSQHRRRWSFAFSLVKV